MTPNAALADLWQLVGLPGAALGWVELTGREPVLPSSFAVGTAAQATIAAAALAACELGHARCTERQRVSVAMEHAALECSGWFSLDGRVPEPWDPFSGLYRSADGWVRIHANFAHHREGALRLLGLDPANATRADAERAMLPWCAVDFETAAADAGLVATALRTFEQWDATEQGQAVAAQPLMHIERIGDAPPLKVPPLTSTQRPLEGLRVLDLTRILAGPVGGRALAAFGGDVLLVNSPHLPNIEAITDTSRGKRSCHVDLRQPQGQADLEQLLATSHVFLQGYRPGALQSLGWGPQEVARRRPGIVHVSLSAYGGSGPWADRRGFDSLLQTALGFNHAEGQAAGDGRPRALPMQILDQASGHLIALGAAAALWRQQREGGSWQVQVSLAQTAHWLRSLGRIENGMAAPPPSRDPYLETVSSGFGELTAVRPSADLSRTPARYTLPAVPPGHSPAHW
jgi:crotonobetainyl-CoA:carnitine CoA-transferase CaiB-like acyl-CoA transferase